MLPEGQTGEAPESSNKAKLNVFLTVHHELTKY